MNISIQHMLEICMRFVGIREEEGNRGMFADFFNWYVIGDFREYPIGGKGAPWCATYLGTCGRLAMGVKWPLPITASMSSVQKIAEWGAEKGIIAATPDKGDLLCVSRAPGKWSHITIIQSVDGADVRTIEGNTNDNGSTEGVGVFELNRTVRDADRLLRWSNLL